MQRKLPLYMKNYGYLLDDPEIFSIFFNGLSRSTRDNQQNDVILITGPKGEGKTQLVKTLAYIYHNHFPQNRVIIFCGIKGLYILSSEYFMFFSTFWIDTVWFLDLM
jgi:SpoVK/Ycf46/Vps4 family AAA+-type ATPase